MTEVLYPARLEGCIAAIPSKSQAHRLLICAALADTPSAIRCPQLSKDIRATMDCL
ncbi:MAG: 3-phosphoshikimate 1-carboxyvinyltransferase, partial [Oscillospiraceae bacterium]|nr:3-phosphoshikimate 1-carboxyvinyltransferase [Oscillospiraceae bacterium]